MSKKQQHSAMLRWSLAMGLQQPRAMLRRSPAMGRALPCPTQPNPAQPYTTLSYTALHHTNPSCSTDAEWASTQSHPFSLP